MVHEGPINVKEQRKVPGGGDMKVRDVFLE
jgi:hypothetical protein